MVLDPHGNGFAQMDLEGRKRKTSERLARATRRMDDALRLSERVVHRPPSRSRPPQMNVVRMRPFLPAIIVTVLAIIAIPLSFVLARATATDGARASKIMSIEYDSESRTVRVHLDNQVRLDVPVHVHLRYTADETDETVIQSYTLSDNGQDLDINIKASPNHAMSRDGIEYVMRPNSR